MGRSNKKGGSKKKMVPFNFGANHVLSAGNGNSSGRAEKSPIVAVGREAPWAKKNGAFSEAKKNSYGIEKIQRDQEEESAKEKVQASILTPCNILERYQTTDHANMVKELETASTDAFALAEELKASRWAQHPWANQLVDEITTLANALSKALEQERDRIGKIQRELNESMRELTKLVISNDFMPKEPAAMGTKMAVQMEVTLGHETQTEIIRRHPELWNNDNMRRLSIHYKYSPMSVFLHPEMISKEICDEGFAIYRLKGGRLTIQ